MPAGTLAMRAVVACSYRPDGPAGRMGTATSPLSAQVTTELPAGAPTARMGRRALRSGLVLAFPAAEVAGILGTTATGINSPLIRAWASRQRRPWYAPDRLNFARGSR